MTDMTPDTDLIARAHVLGGIAALEGRRAIPEWDTELKALIGSLTTFPYFKAWLNGYATAALA